MTLAKYNTKRKFTETSEPEGAVKKTKANRLKFVIQKHDASSLHYDLRLEMEGALKSWAVPKGPSMDPEVKRLAMMVEDHPMDYRRFEGIIPEGNYGAGTVIVWDEGSLHATDVLTKAASEKRLLEGMKNGAFHFVLDGHKLKGEFMLFRFPKAGDNAWLLEKAKDEYATTRDITRDEKSVKSGLDLKQVEKKHKKKA